MVVHKYLIALAMGIRVLEEHVSSLAEAEHIICAVSATVRASLLPFFSCHCRALAEAVVIHSSWVGMVWLVSAG